MRVPENKKFVFYMYFKLAYMYSIEAQMTTRMLLADNTLSFIRLQANDLHA